MLAAILSLHPEDAAGPRGVVVVLGTTATTYLAHVVSHAIGAGALRAGDGDDEAAVAADRREAAGETGEELRDAVPILSAGVPPTLVLALAWLTDLDVDLALWLSALTVVVRLLGLGVSVGRLSGRPPSLGQTLTGLVVGLVCGVVVLLKVTLLH